MQSASKIESGSLDARTVRYRELIPCKTAFIDSRTPGSDRKENFCLIGGGVSENSGQHVHIRSPHCFDIGAARQPNGCKNSHHSHDTEEVFVVHKGNWKFTWGENGEDGEAVLGAGDTISIPMQVFRGFENIGADDGFLLSILGLQADGSAGHVTWAPQVFADARNHGLVLLEDGKLIDTAAGQKIPPDGVVSSGPDPEQLKQFRTMTLSEMLDCVAFDKDLADARQQEPKGGLNRFPGVEEIPVAGCANPSEALPKGKLGWEHGFQLRRLRMNPGSTVPVHSRQEEEVIFVHRGCMEVTVAGETTCLGTGDLLTTPPTADRTFSNPGEEPLDAVLVRGGNHPGDAEYV